MKPERAPFILIVCTANICRSPMAASILQHQLDRMGGRYANIRVESAGTWTESGNTPPARVISVMADRGISVENHRSRQVTRKLMYQANLILTMEAGHKEALSIEFPMLKDKIYLLSEMSGHIQKVHDPIGGSLEEYEETAQELEKLIQLGLKKILNLVKVH